MERYKEKMKEFVARLWTNPNIQSVPVVRKENQILGFIREKQQNLQAAFQRPEFFPGISWDESIRLLFTELTDTILGAMRPLLEEILERAAHPALKTYFQNEGGLAIQPDQFRDFILNSMRVKPVRDQYLAVVQTITSGFFERYVPAILTRRKVIYMDVVRRDRTSLEPAYMPEYFRLMALFRPLFFHKLSQGPSENMSLDQLRKDPRMFDKVAGELLQQIRMEIGQVPEAIVRPGLDSNLSLDDNPDISGASRLINILVSRSQEYDPQQKQDRGAESPDKSWFNINRRTAKYSGFDARFLEELYQVAGEEGW